MQSSSSGYLVTSNQGKPSQLTKTAAVGLGLGFVVLSVGIRLVLGRILRSASPFLEGACSVTMVIAGTAVLQWYRPSWQSRNLALLPTTCPGRSLRLFFKGLLVGGLLFVIAFGLALALGGIRLQWQPTNHRPILVVLEIGLLFTMINVSWEEWTFRGWPFSILAASIGPHFIAIAAAILFGVAHLSNPHWTVIGLASAVFAGLLLSYAMLVSANIVLPIGLHLGWNFIQFVLTSTQLWHVTRNPNAWLSGGDYGLDASVPGIGVTAFAAAIAFWIFLRSERRPQLEVDLKHV